MTGLEIFLYLMYIIIFYIVNMVLGIILTCCFLKD